MQLSRGGGPRLNLHVSVCARCACVRPKQKTSLTDPSVIRKYVAQCRDPADPLSPGPKFGYWNDCGPEPSLASHHLRTVRLDCVLRQPDGAAADGAPADAVKRAVEPPAVDRQDTLVKALQRANDERRERERVAAALADATATLAKERDVAKRATVDRLQAERKVKGLQQRGDDALAEIETLKQQHEQQVAALAADHSAGLAAIQSWKDEQMASVVAEKDAVVAGLTAERDAAKASIVGLKDEIQQLTGRLEAAERQHTAAVTALKADRDKAAAAARSANAQWKACAAELSAATKVSQNLNQELISAKVSDGGGGGQRGRRSATRHLRRVW